jgi:N utilization substance protein A
MEVILYNEQKAMEIIVPDNQTSLAIGKKGQNVRLAVKLTGWKIDIKSKSEADGESKTALEQLMQIPGIGETSAQALLNEGYNSARDIAKAEIDELTKLPGFGEKKAQSIKEAAEELLKQATVKAESAAEAPLPEEG